MEAQVMKNKVIINQFFDNTIMNKKIIFLIIGLMIVLIYSCKSKQSIDRGIKNFNIREYIKESSSVFLDLSNKDLTEFPDLSKYEIKNLDLSGNKIKKIKLEFFPSGIYEINLSDNYLNDSLEILDNKTLKIIDLSKNNLTYVYVLNCIKNLNVANNDLEDLYFNCSLSENSMDTLDVSNNKDLNNVLRFNPKAFKTVIRENIKNDKELIWSLNAPIVNKVKIPE